MSSSTRSTATARPSTCISRRTISASSTSARATWCVSKTVVAYAVAGERQGRDHDMSGDVSALDLFGTDEPIAERRLLTAGPLTRHPRRRQSAHDLLCRRRSGARHQLPGARRFLGHLQGSPVERRDHRKLTALSRSTYDALCSGPERPLRLPDDHHRRSVRPAHHGGGRRGARPTFPPIAPASSCCIRPRRPAGG